MIEPLPCADDLSRFLSWLRPDGSETVCVAIAVGPEPIKAFPLTQRNADAVLARGAEAKRNLYFTPAVCTVSSKKPTKAEVRACALLWVDIDLTAGEDHESGVAAILDRLKNTEGVPRPTCAVMTGGGVQAYWCLDDWTEDLERIESANRWLRTQLGADHCWNVERVLRLPGSINWPDKRKRAKGRIPRTAEVVSLVPERVYKLADFGSEEQPKKGKRSRAASPTEASEVKVGSLAMLGLSPHLRAVVELGEDPKQPWTSPDSSGSGRMACATLALVRGGVDPALVEAILLDDRWKIGEHARSQQDPVRAVRRALDFAERNITPSDPDGFVAGDEDLVEPFALGDVTELARELERDLGLVVNAGGLHLYDQDTGVWRAVPDSHARRIVLEYSGRPVMFGKKSTRPLKMSERLVDGTVSALADLKADSAFFANARRGVQFANGFLDIATGEFCDASPDHRARVRVACDYDPSATSAAWDSFMGSVWGEDYESINLCEQVLGYLLSGRTDLHKMFVFQGPPRSGKGTLFRQLQHVLGGAVQAIKLGTIGDSFGLDHVLGASVLLDAEYRRTGSKESNAVPLMLSITGEDDIPIKRKHKGTITTRLGARLVVGTNPPFGLSDMGGAMTSRMVIVSMPRSHLGKEDTCLGARLAAETPGVVNAWLGGLRRLEADGRFIVPSASHDATETAKDIEDPSREFFRDCCVFEEGATVRAFAIYSAYRQWCSDSGVGAMSAQRFAPKLLNVPGVRRRKLNTHTEYEGVRVLAFDSDYQRQSFRGDCD